MSAITPCPPDDQGRHLWCYVTAHQLRRRGWQAELVLEFLLHEMRRTGPEKRLKVERVVASVFGQPSPSTGARRHAANDPVVAQSLNIRGSRADLVELFVARPKSGWPRSSLEFVQSLFPGGYICVGTEPWRTVTLPSWKITDAVLDGCRHIVPCTLARERGLTKDGRASTRCEDMVATRDYFISEFDGLSLEDQAARIRFLERTFRVPLVAIVHSGGTSLHAWWLVKGLPQGEVTRFIETAITAVGADASFRSPIQLTRLPFAVRPETGRVQALVFFNLSTCQNEF